jgi:tetratricopeptide (TPR) repeat protein
VTIEPDEARWEAAAARHEEAVALAAAGQLDAAEHLGRAALAELEAALPPHHPDVANALDTLAGIAAARGRSLEARGLWRRALAAFEVYRAEEVVQRMRLPVLRNFAYALVQAGEYAEARAHVDAAIAEARRLDGDGEEAAAGHALLGVLCKFTGRWDEAEAAYTEAARLLQDEDGGLPPALVHNLAGLACARGDHARAAELLEASIAARLGDGDDDPLALGTDLAGLGDALAGLGRTREAIARYEEALALYRASGHGDHPEVAYGLHNLGDAHADAGDAAAAERCYREALARKEAAFGAVHPEVAATLANLAALLGDGGRPAEARPLLERALRVARTLDEGHPIREGCEALARRLGP